MAVKDPDLEALRQLLLQPEQRALHELGQPEVWQQKVAEVLSEAIVRRANQDHSVQRVLAPMLEETLITSVQRNPRQLAEMLFPIMLPAIRRAVGSLFTSLVQSLNRTLDQALSLRGLRWRIEALTTGKSFAEVVLSHTLEYRVEQVLLIERQAGLMMAHVSADGVKVQDGGMVSAMLTAIGDFVRDSFDPQAGLDTVELGERVLMVDQGSKTIIAAVIRGAPLPEFKERLQDVHLEIQARFAPQLDAFQGNPQTLAACHPLLENLLESRFKALAKRPPYLVMVLSLLVLLGVGWWGWQNYQTTQAWKTYLDRLRSTPGLVVTDAPSRYMVRGLRDPLAPDPTSLLRGLRLDPTRLHMQWEPYRSLESALNLKRIQQYLSIPPQTFVGFSRKKLIVKWAPAQWLQQLKNLAPALGIEQIEVQR